MMRRPAVPRRASMGHRRATGVSIVNVLRTAHNTKGRKRDDTVAAMSKGGGGTRARHQRPAPAARAAPTASSRGSPGVATIADVASACGFSAMTVSRVINNEPNVREATRTAIKAAIADLNYSPNLAARALAGAEQIRLGLLYSNPSAAYLSEFLVGSLDQARINHVQLVVEKCEAGHDEGDRVRAMLSSGIDGIILPPPLCDSQAIRDAVAGAGGLAVAVASGMAANNLSLVRIDDFAAAADMTRHIIALGHRCIGFITGNPNQTATAQRLAGYRSALIDAGIACDPRLVAPGLFTYRSGLAAAQQLLDQDPRPTAIFASNDDMAAAAVAIAHRRHLDVPDDLTICGFDDTEVARSGWPELTTIHQPIARMSRAAVALLVEQIKARRAGQADNCAQILLDFTLIRRGSDSVLPTQPRMA
jgi:LacI family transcriptional regulator